jgi:hypothetical protein
VRLAEYNLVSRYKINGARNEKNNLRIARVRKSNLRMGGEYTHHPGMST